ncbi:hypothetical protein GCM10027068_37880 [Prescottella soli]
MALSPAEEKEDSGTEHHDESDQTDDREFAQPHIHSHAHDEENETQNEEGHRLQPTLTGGGTHSPAPHSGRELGILGVERALDLVEHALLVLGEWHGTSPGTKSWHLIRGAARWVTD